MLTQQPEQLNRRGRATATASWTGHEGERDDLAAPSRVAGGEEGRTRPGPGLSRLIRDMRAAAMELFVRLQSHGGPTRPRKRSRDQQGARYKRLKR